jgi:transposase
MVSKYGHHLPLTRQSAIYAREGVEIDVSTLAVDRRGRRTPLTG